LWANREGYLDHEFTSNEIEAMLNQYEIAPTIFNGYDDETPATNDPNLDFKDWK